MYVSPRAACEVLDLLEVVLQCKLPSDFRRFQMDRDHDNDYCNATCLYNNAAGASIITISSLFPLIGTSPERVPSPVTIAYAINTARHRSIGEGLLPHSAVPIGRGCEEEEIVLMIDKSRYGEVWLKTFEQLHSRGKDNPNDDLWKIANTFEEFLDNIATSHDSV